VPVEVPDLRGEADARFEVERSGRQIRVRRLEGSKPWRVLLVGVFGVGAIRGGQAETAPDGTLIAADEGSDLIEAALPE